MKNIHFAGLPASVLLILAAGCSSAGPGESSDQSASDSPGASSSTAPGTIPGTATTELAISRPTIISRAEQWVGARLHYCEAAHGAVDGDSSCWAWEGSSHRCDRESNAAWNAYRSDCSGFVTWSWGLPAIGDGGYTTYDFAPHSTTFSKVIDGEDLQPGDALNLWTTHIVLFKQWVETGVSAVFIEEPGCSSSEPYAHEFTSNVSIKGSSVTIDYEGETFVAIRFTGSTGTEGGGGGGGVAHGASCHSDTLGRSVADNTCVQSSSDRLWYQCESGAWVDRQDDPSACSATYPLGHTSESCHSDTLDRTMPDNACVQSASNGDWYQCANGSWVDRWTDPTACDGTYPLDGCYSDTLGKVMPDNACVQSRSNKLWYQCDKGSWVERSTDPTACKGQYPL